MFQRTVFTHRLPRFSRLLQALGVVAVALTLSACASPNKMYNERPQLVASPDKASMMLAEAADRASVALETLAAVEQTRTPAATVEPIHDAPIELRRAVSVSWVGPVEPVAKMLADRASYDFIVLGNAPSIQSVVNVDAENAPVIDVLRSIGLQLGGRATLRVNADRGVIELHYAPPGDPTAITITP